MLKALKALLVAGALALAGTMTSALAQEKQPPAAQPEVTLVGLPVYSSDGQKLGAVTEVGVSGTQRAVRAEIGGFLGLGSSPVVIPANMFEHKGDRIEVLMTADEVNDTISKQKRQLKQ
jgi:sporulation protein YlmC with PRC-barrel domain